MEESASDPAQKVHAEKGSDQGKSLLHTCQTQKTTYGNLIMNHITANVPVNKKMVKI